MEFVIYVFLFFAILIISGRLGWYMAGKGWKDVHIHSCGYVTEFYYSDVKNNRCPRCGEKNNWKPKVGHMNFFGGYRFKEEK